MKQRTKAVKYRTSPSTGLTTFWIGPVPRNNHTCTVVEVLASGIKKFARDFYGNNIRLVESPLVS